MFHRHVYGIPYLVEGSSENYALSGICSCVADALDQYHCERITRPVSAGSFARCFKKTVSRTGGSGGEIGIDVEISALYHTSARYYSAFFRQ